MSVVEVYPRSVVLYGSRTGLRIHDNRAHDEANDSERVHDSEFHDSIVTIDYRGHRITVRMHYYTRDEKTRQYGVT